MSGYSIRWFEQSDVDRFLELHGDVFDTWETDRDWFEWKYESNPFVDHVPIVVAARNGQLVGARPFFALSMAVGGDRVVALQPADTMVHPDHRGNGLFTRMTAWALERYRERAPALFFNFPNEQSLPGYEKLGWETVGVEARFYRVEDSRRVLQARNGAERGGVLGRVSGPVVSAYNRLRDGLAGVPSDVRIERRSALPATELASIYERSIPDSIHAIRDEPFLDWRFGSPTWRYTTYLAGGATDRVGVIVGAADHPSTGLSVARIVDTLPVGSHGTDDQGLALLDRLLRDHPETDVFVAPASAFPARQLVRLGFYCDDWPPLRYLARGSPLAARSDRGWELNGVDVRDPGNWMLSFVELDTS